MIILRATLILESTICPNEHVPMSEYEKEIVAAIKDRAKRISDDDINIEWTIVGEGK